MTDTLKLSPNERMDLSDLQYAVAGSQQAFARLGNANFLTDPTGTRQMWVIRGFEMSSVANQLTVNLGAAMLAQRDGVNVTYGVVCAEGDAQKGLDLSSYPAGTYNIYIRFNYVDGSYNSRIFWSPTAGGSEYAQTVPTRSSAQWELRCEANSPGAEWLKIGQVVASGPSIAVTDMRPLYFEGQVDQGYTQIWGTGANDRSAGRAQYGIRDLQTFTQAMRTCLEDIKGPGLRRWYAPDVGGLNIGFVGAAVEDRLAVGDAGTYLQGDTTAPSLRFESASYMGFSRTAKAWSWNTSGTSLSAIDIVGNHTMAGGLTVGTMTPYTGAVLYVNGGTLGTAAGSVLEISRLYSADANADYLRTYSYRGSAGTTSLTVDWFLQRLVDPNNKGFVGFYGSSGVSGGLEGIGLGIGASSGAPTLFVASNAVGIGFSPASGISNSASTPLQLNATTGADRYFAAQKAGSAGAYFGYSNGALSLSATAGSATAVGGVLRQVAADPFYFVAGTTSAGMLSSAARWYLGSVTSGWATGYPGTAPVGATYMISSGASDYAAVMTNSAYGTNAGKLAILGPDTAGAFTDYWTYNTGSAAATQVFRTGSPNANEWGVYDVANSTYALRYYANSATLLVPNNLSFVAARSQQLWFGPFQAINAGAATFQQNLYGTNITNGTVFIPLNLPTRGTITAWSVSILLTANGSGSGSVTASLYRHVGAAGVSVPTTPTQIGSAASYGYTSSSTGLQLLGQTGVSDQYGLAQTYSYYIQVQSSSSTISVCLLGGYVTVSTVILENGIRA